MSSYDESPLSAADLAALKVLAGMAPAPSPAVLAAARPQAVVDGSPGAALDDVPLDDVPLVPRRLQPPRRRRQRRVVSLTVALACTVVVALVVGLVARPDRRVETAPGDQLRQGPVPSGLVTPTDEELARAAWLHVQTTAQFPAGAAPGSAGYRNAWLAHGGSAGSSASRGRARGARTPTRSSTGTSSWPAWAR
jgi:hypothetical protein